MEEGRALKQDGEEEERERKETWRREAWHAAQRRDTCAAGRQPATLRIPPTNAALPARPPKQNKQVLQRRQGVNMRVNLKARGDVFGEVSLMYSCARTATVAATTDAVVWVLHRDTFR